MNHRIVLTTILMLVAAPALAQSTSDGVGHRGSGTLFSPTPREEMRPLSTDRPDQTESPYSVDPGHLQVESDVVSYAVTRAAGTTTSETHAMNMFIRIGLTEHIDAQVALLPLVVLRSKATGQQAVGQQANTRTGVGDTTVRLKVNLIGNDDGAFALGVLPMVTLPTATRTALGAGKLEYAFAIPMGLSAPGGFGFGAMPQLDLVGGSKGGYVPEFTQTLTGGHALVGDLAAFTEVVTTVTFEGHTAASFELHGGLTYSVGDDILVDAGAFSTLVGSGDGLRLFLGLTVRR
jgi:hypothetical protein